MKDFYVGEAILLYDLRKDGIILSILYDSNLDARFQVLFINHANKPEIREFSRKKIRHLSRIGSNEE